MDFKFRNLELRSRFNAVFQQMIPEPEMPNTQHFDIEGIFCYFAVFSSLRLQTAL